MQFIDNKNTQSFQIKGATKFLSLNLTINKKESFIKRNIGKKLKRGKAERPMIRGK